MSNPIESLKFCNLGYIFFISVTILAQNRCIFEIHIYRSYDVQNWLIIETMEWYCNYNFAAGGPSARPQTETVLKREACLGISGSTHCLRESFSPQQIFSFLSLHFLMLYREDAIVCLFVYIVYSETITKLKTLTN